MFIQFCAFVSSGQLLNFSKMFTFIYSTRGLVRGCFLTAEDTCSASKMARRLDLLSPTLNIPKRSLVVFLLSVHVFLSVYFERD